MQKRASGDTAFEYYSFAIKDGDKSVFNYTYQFKDCPEIADDEGAMVIIFEIPDSVNSFQLKDSADLRRAKALVNYACFCYPSGPILLRSGTIEGQRSSNNRWHVKASLRLSNASNNIDFEADFLKQ